jgi:hypothetical protein
MKGEGDTAGFTILLALAIPGIEDIVHILRV